MQSDYTKLIAAFAPMFTKQVWPYVLTLLTGAILAHGQRTVSAILRVTGLVSPCGQTGSPPFLVEQKRGKWPKPQVCWVQHFFRTPPISA